MNWESIYYWRSWLDHEHNEEYTDRDKGQSLYPNGCSKYTSDHKNLDIYKMTDKITRVLLLTNQVRNLRFTYTSPLVILS